MKNIDRFECSNNNNTYFRCFQCNEKKFDTLEKLHKHTEKCIKNISDIEEVLPTKDKNDITKFVNTGNTFKHPFYIVADFESTLEKITEIDSNSNTQ